MACLPINLDIVPPVILELVVTDPHIVKFKWIGTVLGLSESNNRGATVYTPRKSLERNMGM